MTNANDETATVERVQELMFDGLTRKQAAIVATYEGNETETYAEIARMASEVLPEDVDVTPEYVSAQIHERFLDEKEDEVEKRETIEVPQEDWERLQTIVNEAA